MVSVHQFRLFFSLLVIKTGFISSFYLFESRKHGVATIEQCTQVYLNIFKQCELIN